MSGLEGISKRIGSVTYSCLSPDEIRKMSVIKVLTADTYDDEGYPIDMGLMDPHMGVIEPGLRCKTCGNKTDECTGHFGHIDLAMPVIHVCFIDFIKKLLLTTCSSCGRLMLKEEEIAKYKQALAEMKKYRLDQKDERKFYKAIYDKVIEDIYKKQSANNSPCPHCGKEQVKVKLYKPTTFRDEKDNHKLTPKEVRERLEMISDSDLEVLGYDPTTFRPEWMVLTALPVPPVTVRPSITLESGDRSEDDITHKLVDVLRINQRLRENRDAGAPQLIIEDLWELLQYHVTTYFNNQTSGIPPARHRSGRPLKTLIQRLKGKEGRFRSNISGKRVNFSARTVISPDPLLSINEVGVPEDAARELTVPVHINSNNIEMMRDLVRRGTCPTTENGRFLTGANYVIRSDGRKIRLTDKNAAEVADGLDIDYTVERQLQDGDIVLFNRQPSLHRMSIMAHRVRVMEGHTFRFNLCVCPPYNADFDGDEMNLHVLQSEEARAEARIIMQVQENILSPRYGGPIIGAIHDHITGAYILTNNNPRFDRIQTMNILTKLDNISIPEPMKDKDGNEYWTGKQLFSIVLPKGLDLQFKASICKGCKDGCKKEMCENDAYVKISDGELICGTIDVKAIGNSKGRIIDRIARDFGTDRARQFINEVTRLVLGAIMNHGFSTGIDDEDISDDAKVKISSFNQEQIDRVNELVESYKVGMLDQMPGRSLEETLEVLIMGSLEEARNNAGEVVADELGMKNSAVVMAKTGARGSMLNLSQMAGCVGQQTVRGDRLSRGYYDRTLPHFKRGDLGAFARGFVTHSYKTGLSPTEFFFHAMGGREGLVDTAARTSRSGYMQRILVSAFEDLKLKEDESVRNEDGTIIQFSYGEDGIDPSRAVGGEVLDYDDLFIRVLGEKEAAPYLKLDRKDNGEDYGTHESDSMDYSEDEEDGDGFDMEESDGEEE